MNRDYVLGFWWDGLHETEARNGYNRKTDELLAQIRIGRFHVYWGMRKES